MIKMEHQINPTLYDELESDKKRKRALFFSKFVGYIPLIGLAAIIALYFISLAVTGYRFSIQLEVIVNNIILVAFVATGASFIFAIGSFDLSLGANMLLMCNCRFFGVYKYRKPNIDDIGLRCVGDSHISCQLSSCIGI